MALFKKKRIYKRALVLFDQENILLNLLVLKCFGFLNSTTNKGYYNLYLMHATHTFTDR